MPAADTDAYLAELPADQRDALNHLRRQILAAAPGAEECISYGMPGFRLNGMLVWLGAGKAHCALYPGAVVADFADQLKDYQTSKGAIRFQPDHPLPEALVTAIVARRIAQNAEKVRVKAARKKKA